nr:MAG TPA: hypothetical protein [Caudoviricetes sp.]
MFINCLHNYINLYIYVHNYSVFVNIARDIY